MLFTGTPLPLRIVLGITVAARPTFFMMTDVLAAAKALCEVIKVRASERAMAFPRRFMRNFLI